MWKAERVQSTRDARPTNAEVIARAIELAEQAGKRGRHTEFVVKARADLVEAATPDDVEAFEEAPATTEPLEDFRSDIDLTKLGARNAQADLAHIQAAHDHLAALGASCGDCEDVKAAAISREPELAHLRRSVETLQKRLNELAAEPAPPKALVGAARAVSKAEDASPGDPTALSAGELKKYLDSLPEEERGRLQLMAALRQPIAIAR